MKGIGSFKNESARRRYFEAYGSAIATVGGHVSRGTSSLPATIG